jgi:hypothetical protein
MKTLLIILAIVFTLTCRAQTQIDTTQHLYYILGGIPNGFNFSTPERYTDATKDSVAIDISFVLMEYGDRDTIQHPHTHTFIMPSSYNMIQAPDSCIAQCLRWLQKKYYINGLNAIGN